MATQMQKYYAVCNGREGTQIYLTWEEAKLNVLRDVGVRTFLSLDLAQAYIEGWTDANKMHYASQPVQQHTPPPQPGSAGPAAYVADHSEDAMDVGNEYSDVEISAGQPSARSQPLECEADSDIEILDGPPPDWGTSSRPQLRTPGRQQQPQAGPSRRSRPRQAPPYAVKRELRRPSESRTPTRQQPTQAGPSRQISPRSVPPAVVKQESKQPKQEPVIANGGGIDDAPAPTAPAGLLTAGPVHEIQLSPEQLYVLAKVKKGDSVFFTGSAGTGKSVLLRAIIKHYGGRPSKRLGVTASTGIASINIGGCTLHSWAGIGLGKDDKYGLTAKVIGVPPEAYKIYIKKCEELWAKKARGEELTWDEQQHLDTDPADSRKNNALDRWRHCKVLIIDEISMIDGKLFDKLEYIGRRLRKNALPFGGIQLVISGDFFQLPPVPDKSATGAQIPACFAFDSESWARCVGPPISLEKVFRQKDQKFVTMLNKMRLGNMDEETALFFHQLSRPVKYDDGIEPTELYPTRDEAGSANSRRLKALQGEPRNYKALDVPGRDKNGRTYPADRVERALKDAIVPKILPLKIGAQVMLVKNIIQGLLVNGSLGRVVAFYKPRDARAKGIEIAIPDNQQGLRKALGKEDDKNDAGVGGRADAKRPHEKLQEQAQAEQREQTLKTILASNDVWPCVQFHSGPLMLCVRLSFEVINADGNIEAVREQVPLILAWALSIHKSQGQTLEHVRVNLDRTFEKGQAYVALSRATRMETLEVINFDSSKVRAHPRVLEWMSEHMQMPELPYIRDESDEELGS